MRPSAVRLLVAISVSLAVAPALFAAKPGPAPVPPSAMIFGTYGTTYSSESFYFLSTNLQTYTRSISVPADGAWFFGQANFRNYLEFDCDHHYRADLSPGDSTYSPFFTLGMLPAPYDVCSFGNCYSCRVDWGNRKQPEYLTTGVGPAFLDQGSRTVTLSTLNGGGDYSSNPDNVNLWIAQVNRTEMSGMRLFQGLSTDDPSPASDTVVNDRTFNAESDDRVPVVPVFQHGTDEFPPGPNMNWSVKWDTGTVVTPDQKQPSYPNGLIVLGVPIPKMSTGNHSFTVTAKLPGGKTFTATMSVYVFEKMVFIKLDNSFDTANPTDDLPKFVPGSDINGNSVTIKQGSPQIIYVEVLAGGKVEPVTVELQSPSAYPGIAMNYPADSSDVTPDMDFGSPSSLSQTKAFPSGKIKHVQFPLYVRDYAANATLHVTMQIGKKTFDLKQTLPRDVDGNHLPDAGWYAGTTKVDTTGMQPGSDGDSQPAMRLAIPPDAPNGDGDNLTNFEEYRGFVLQGQHQRFDPAVKDFIVDVSAFGGDLQFIPAFWPTTAHIADPGEYSSSDAINGNSDGTLPGCGDSAPNGHHFENVKKVVNGGTAPPVFGTAIPRFGDNECYNALGPCTPNNTGDVVVYVDDINARAAADGKSAADALTLRRNTVAHESGHATNLYHVDALSCIMYGAGFTAQGAWNNLPTTACTGVTATIYDCTPCGPTLSIDNVPNYNETDSLRVKPQF